MKLKNKLKLVLPLLSVILLLLSYFQFVDGYNFSKKINKISQSDAKLMQELLNIKGRLELNSIDKNMQILNNLLEILFDKFNISSTSKNVTTRESIDRIGQFKDVEITVKGDFWQQLYFLQQVNKNMRNFVVIDQLSGNNVQALFNTRIYGHAN